MSTSAPTPHAVLHPRDALVGQQVGSFRIERVLGRGAMGTVYCGVHTIIGSRVAIKVMHPEQARDPERVARFCAEGRAANQVRHENIVSIFDLSVDPPDLPYMVMEYLEGEPLSALLTAPVDARALVPILIQVCRGLQAAHEHGVVHRDLEPDNIFLLSRSGRGAPRVKLLDFGVARPFQPEFAPEQTAGGMRLGTPSYMAPEQWGSPDVDPRCDVYSVGVTAWRALVGRLPFTGEGAVELPVAHRTGTAAHPHQLNPAVPERLSLVVMKAMAPAPEHRHRTASELGRALEEVAAELGLIDEAQRASLPRSLPRSEPPSPPAASAAAPPVVRQLGPQGQELGRHGFSELTRGGVFLECAAPPPELFTKLLLELPAPGGPLRVQAEVVRHVGAEQAAQWKMRPGFAVQFMALPHAAKQALRAWAGSGAPGASPSPEAPESPEVKADVQAMVAAAKPWNERANHYLVLKLSRDATFGDIRSSASRLIRQFALTSGSMTETQARQVHAMMGQIREAAQALLDPVGRAQYDASLGNYRGVARCLEAGLPPSMLGSLRARFCAANPAVPRRSQQVVEDAELLLARGHREVALQLYQRALQHDPLNVALHERLQELERARRTGGAAESAQKETGGHAAPAASP